MTARKKAPARRKAARKTVAKKKTSSKTKTTRKASGARKASKGSPRRKTAKRSPRKVFWFGAGRADGRAEMKEVLGGKGANLAEMTRLGVPVPPGFTISTAVCAEYEARGQVIPAGVRRDSLAALFPDLELDASGVVNRDFATGRTNLSWLWAGGDAANGGNFLPQFTRRRLIQISDPEKTGTQVAGIFHAGRKNQPDHGRQGAKQEHGADTEATV